MAKNIDFTKKGAAKKFQREFTKTVTTQKFTASCPHCKRRISLSIDRPICSICRKQIDIEIK